MCARCPGEPVPDLVLQVAAYLSQSILSKRTSVMEYTFQGRWRMVALPLLFTAVVVGSALGFAFS